MRDRYISIMRKLHEQPIKSPTLEDFINVFPHLNEDALNKLHENGGYIACPPTIVTHSFMMMQYDKEEDKIIYAFSSRAYEAYADHKLHGDCEPTYDNYEREAMEYASKHWGESLIVDNWVDIQSIYIQDPSKKSTGLFSGYPVTTTVLYVGYNRDWNELINDHSKPQSDLINESISFLTTDKFIADNMKGGRGGFTAFNCACCSGGLGLSKCESCNREFRDDHFRSGWNTPLPAKMSDYLQQQGFAFKTDPTLARTQEREIWQKHVEMWPGWKDRKFL